LIYEGLIPCRPNDKTALGFYSAWRQRSAQEAAGLPSQANETDIEVTSVRDKAQPGSIASPTLWSSASKPE
jgi:hypothetical protein